MRSPLLIALAAGVVSLAVAFVPVVWHMLRPGPPAAPAQDAPWQVAQPAPGQVRVFGLDLPGATLAQARARWGEGLALAVIDDGRGALALEGYVEQFSAGGVTGRLVLAFAADAARLARWRDALPGMPTGSGATRHALTEAALQDVPAAPIGLVGLSFVPSAQLDAPTVAARFGEPAERIDEGPQRQHWLYPALGLAVMLDADGRDLLQYVAPADFERRLAVPLRKR